MSGGGGSSSWIPLKVSNKSNPVEAAEYATALDLEDEPAFALWVPYTLKKRDRVIAGLNMCMKKKSHGFGV